MAEHGTTPAAPAGGASPDGAPEGGGPIRLPETEHRLLERLVTAGAGTEAALAAALGEDQSKVHAAALALADRGLATLEERAWRELSLAAPDASLPDREVIRALDRMGGRGAIPDIPAHGDLDRRAVGQALRWLKARGWILQEGRELALTEAGRAALDEEAPDERLIALLRDTGPLREDAVEGLDVDAALALLAGRRVVRVRERTERRVLPTEAGRAAWPDGVVLRRQVNLLTSAMLQDGGWREVDFRPYDVRAGAARVVPGKTHPFRRILAETRRAFLELGFTEVASPMVESSFWDFDALFQPQDHPAREMQDTFYVARPAEARLPDPAYVDAVRRTHEDGGDSGSVGWRYDWSEALARRPVLRTHATAATIRALAADPRAPRKVFTVAPVFRRETVDYKHLPVFHQVDGIVVDEKASFAMLLGVLSAFYRKMGFERFEFRPAFFPYTEPSVEVFVWFDEKRDWVELGGAGIFRPEVTEPAGCAVPVLAWGLGLERLAMLRHGLTDIRQLYISDLDWLWRAPLCP